MKRWISAGLLLVVTLCILYGFHVHLNDMPELDELKEFDPSVYAPTHEVQTFRLKANDRDWVLNSVVNYSADGQVECETVYHIDENGQAYYIAPNGNRIDVPSMPDDVTEFLSAWDVRAESHDGYGRVVSRTAYWLREDESSDIYELVDWNYCPDSTTDGNNSVCSFVRTMRIEVLPGEETFMFEGPDNTPVYESTAYEIQTYDKYGNTYNIWIERPCRIVTNRDGYLAMIIVDVPGVYYVYRVDEFGRQAWSATYSKEDMRLMSYTVYSYKEG